MLYFKITKLYMIYKLCIKYVLTFASQPASYVKIHMCGFSDVVNLLVSSPGIASVLWCGELWYESCETWVKIKELKGM